MNILLLGNYPPDGQESMQRFANILYCQLCLFKNCDVELIVPKVHLGPKKISNTFEKWLGYIDKYLLFPKQLRRKLDWADVVHICDHSNSVYVRYLQNVPHVITCHDLLAIRCALGEFSQYATGWMGRCLQKMIFWGLQQSQKIICISVQTQKDVMRLIKTSEQKLSMISLGLNYPYTPMHIPLAKKRLEKWVLPTDVPFFLHVGGNQWYKNRLGVLHIFWHLQKQLPHPCCLVMVGKPFTAKMQHFVAKNNLTNVVELINIDNEDLCALYSMAKALIFPSLQEGFGWPIIEAQACGCQVFTTDKPPMNDIGGKAAIYIDATNPPQAAKQIATKLEYGINAKEKAILNAKRFSIEKMGKSYFEVYQSLLI